MDPLNLKLDLLPVDHLPVMSAVIDRLGIREVLDELLPKHPLSRVSDADCVSAMMLNVLSGRMALFRMENWLLRTDVELLLGQGRQADAFNDTRLAEALDHVDRVGSDRIMGAVVERYLAQDDRPTTYSVHMDTTSFSFYGAYVNGGDPLVTYGHSKARRPDLMQLIFGLSLHGGVGVPLVITIAAGNTSDHVSNRDHLTRLAKLLPDSDDVTIVADCKFVDADTVGRVLGAGFHLISLVPDTFNLRGALIEQAWASMPEASEWPELSRQPGRTKASPERVYQGWSVERPFPVKLRAGGNPDNDTVKSIEDMRFVVVRSSSRAAHFEASLEKKLRKERERLERLARNMNKRGFDCPDDAQRAADDVVRRSSYTTSP